MTPLLLAVVLAAADRGVLVAQSGSIEMFDRTATTRMWSGEGLQTPARIVTSKDQAVIIDPLASQIRIIDLVSGRGTTLRTGETPIDGLFLNGRFYLLERDARALERIGTDGTRASIPLAADPAFLRQAGGRIYVYSRTPGMFQEITTSPFAVARGVNVAPFASDLEVDPKNAYLVYPRGGKIGVVSLTTMKSGGTFDVGAVPVDLAIVSRTLAVADPSAKRVWMVQGQESFARAFARGFLRGLLGLGLAPRNSDFPTGVDRVIVPYAYDSSSGTLYRFSKSKSSIVAKNVAPEGFAVGPAGIYVWDDAVRRLQRFDGND